MRLNCTDEHSDIKTGKCTVVVLWLKDQTVNQEVQGLNPNRPRLCTWTT